MLGLLLEWPKCGPDMTACTKLVHCRGLEMLSLKKFYDFVSRKRMHKEVLSSLLVKLFLLYNSYVPPLASFIPIFLKQSRQTFLVQTFPTLKVSLSCDNIGVNQEILPNRYSFCFFSLFKRPHTRIPLLDSLKIVELYIASMFHISILLKTPFFPHLFIYNIILFSPLYSTPII